MKGRSYRVSGWRRFSRRQSGDTGRRRSTNLLTYKGNFLVPVWNPTGPRITTPKPDKSVKDYAMSDDPSQRNPTQADEQPSSLPSPSGFWGALAVIGLAIGAGALLSSSG